MVDIAFLLFFLFLSISFWSREDHSTRVVRNVHLYSEIVKRAVSETNTTEAFTM